jgi:DNA-binding Lrp family transcriptional regulator
MDRILGVPSSHAGLLLSPQDRAIFAALQTDGRMAFTAVAERVGMSEAHVRRRYEWLTDGNAFAVTAVADPSVLGLGCLAWIGIVVAPRRTEDVAEALVELPGVDYVVISSGRFTVMAEIACPAAADLDRILLQLREIEGIVRTETFVYLKLVRQQFQWLPPAGGDDQPGFGTSAAEDHPRELDELDIAIIRELERDGRASFRDIGRTLNISERTVSSRFSQLNAERVLKVIAVGNPLNFGFNAMAWLGVSLKSGADYDAVTRALAAIPSIDYVVVPAGRYDVMAELVCRDHDAMLRTLTEEIGAISDIAHVETFVYLRLLYKSTAGAWGVGRSMTAPRKAIRGNGDGRNRHAG